MEWGWFISDHLSWLLNEELIHYFFQSLPAHFNRNPQTTTIETHALDYRTDTIDPDTPLVQSQPPTDVISCDYRRFYTVMIQFINRSRL